MELQGNKDAPHDFLSLSLQQRESRPPPPQGFNLETHEFMEPVEEKGRKRNPERMAHVMTVGDGHVAGDDSLAAVKVEDVKCVARGDVCARRSGSDSGNGFGACARSATFAIWQAATIAKDNGNRQPQLPSSSSVLRSISRNAPSHDKKRTMESGSRSSRGFDDEEDEDDGFSRREPQRGEAGGKVDQRVSTHRSKHSATEQRRRSKINDRFQILRDLIPLSDQKRDKASFLLEVIEYIRFLQEKTQKYETTYPGWTEENSKLMTWNGIQVPGDNVADPAQIMKNGSSGFLYPGVSTAQNPVESDLSGGVSYKAMENSTGFANNAVSTSISLPPCSYASAEGGGADVAQPQPGLISDIDNLASQSQSQWLRPSDCSISSDILNGQEDLAIDEGTINISSAYSHNLLNTVSQALVNSGLDLSQATVNVQINLGRRAAGRRLTSTATTSSAKDLDNPPSGNHGVIERSRAISSGEESERATKRRKPHN